MTPIDKNHEPLDTILRRAMRAEPGPVTPECADATSLAAYSDRSLAAAERERLETHFADCMRCQLVLADIARAEESARDARAAAEVPWYRRWRIAIPALGAVAAILIFIAIRRPANEEAKSNEVVAMAKRESPELAAPEPAAVPEMPAVASARAPVAPAPPPAPLASNEIAMNEAKAPAAAAPRAQAMDGTALHRNLRSSAALGAHEMAAPASPAAAPALPPVDAGRVVAIAPAAAPPAAAPAPAPAAPVSNEIATNKANAETAPRGEAMGLYSAQTQQRGEAAPAAPMTAQSGGAAAANAGTPGSLRMAVRGDFTASSVGGATAGAELLGIISAPDRSAIWMIGKNGSVRRRAVDGAMRMQHSGVTTDLVAGSAPSATVCWIVGRSGTIIRTIDGERWELITTPSADNLVGVSATSARDAKVTTAHGQSFATSDGGASWRQQ